MTTSLKSNNHLLRRFLLIFLALLFASVVATTMVVVRIAYTGRFAYLFLVWNLILAWLPFLFALAVLTLRQSKLALGAFGILWLLFFPNTTYLVTDLIHLYHTDFIPIWYDAIMLFAFALTGLMLGLLSLYFVHAVVRIYFGSLIGWMFVGVTVVLGSVGVYIGRFLRWNSWDVFVNPFTLFNDVMLNLFHPDLFLRAVVTTGMLTAVFIVAYVILFLLPRVSLEPA
ncbi:MAG: transposase [Chloroflexi bacterium]|nr:MAG: transposase [Chloroflexota bacterium]